MKLKPLPDYGDHMTMQEFEDSCKSGCFIDYDGHGNYATAIEVSDKVIVPSDFQRGEVDRSFSHVVWFNK